MTRSLVALLAFSLLTAACGDRRAESDKKKVKKVFSEQPKIDYGSIKVAPPPKPAEAPKPLANTWAAKMRVVTSEISADLLKCRNEFMLPFQFQKMRRRDVTWTSLSEMDAICRDGTRKKRGPYKRLVWLSKEHIGQHPALDRYIALGMDMQEHYRVVSLMAKKIGAPKIALITDTAKLSRDRVLKAGLEMEAAGRIVAAWPDDLKPVDDPSRIAKPVDVDTYKKELADRYDFFLMDIVSAYDRYASKSWQYPNMIKYKSYRLWVDIPTKALQQDRTRIEKVTGLTDKTKAQLQDYLAKTDALLAAWRASSERYVKGKKKDTWNEKDLFRKPLIKAQKAWLKARNKALGSKR
ncbi:MAG: hypothetical protein KC502_01795 [Myxococcales bacterium]|nr:hypothetical protein [Myxococcales bacterium]